MEKILANELDSSSLRTSPKSILSPLLPGEMEIEFAHDTLPQKEGNHHCPARE